MNARDVRLRALTELRSLAAPLPLVAARARRRPWQWLPGVLGLVVATAFACAVVAEATVAGDQAARAVLERASPNGDTVQVSADGQASPSEARHAGALLARLGLTFRTRVVLMSEVRLSGVVVRPVAIAPLRRWLGPRQASKLGPCTERGCPMLLVGGAAAPRALDAFGVHLRVVGRAPLRSGVPLGFDPTAAATPAILATGDPRGLDRIPGLSGVFRTQNWLATLPLANLQSWQLASLESRMQRSQVDLQQTGSGFAFSGPFNALDEARAQADAAPNRLLAAGGGAVAALSAFLILAAYGLRHERAADVNRLLAAGARTSQCLVFAAAESAALSVVALVLGAALGIGVAALLAAHAGLPVGGVLAHSLLTTTALAVLIGGWLLATAVIAFVLLAPGAHVADVLAVAAVAALALALTRGASDGGAVTALLAPLACVAAGVLTYRVAAVVLRGGERIARRGPPRSRLALISLARAPVAPALAIAFIALSTGLAGFALAYRSTLLRGTADQAANQVPLDALVAAGPSFRTPLELASAARWRQIADGPILPVRRTYANYLSGGGSVTIAALGVPAAGLKLIAGWRQSDGSAPLATLARRLRPPGPVRNPGPVLTGARSLALSISAAAGGVQVTADLRSPSGEVTRLPLGDASATRSTARTRLPRGRFELEALELSEPAGLRATNGHQNAENPAPTTQFSTGVSLGPVELLGAGGRRLRTVAIGGWHGVGAASGSAGTAGGAVRLRFSDSGMPAVVRPPQPSDSHPIPVLADPRAAAAATAGGQIALTVDGLPVNAHVVGVLRRFPTIASGGAGFIVADQPTLAAALDASLPGQGRPDELWIDTPRAGALRADLNRPPLRTLDATFRADVEHGLRSDPIARGVLGTLLAAAAIAVVLALIGLLVALLGAMRDRPAERELRIHGLGPRALARELRMRIVLAAALGLVAGFALAAVLTRLAVAAVSSAATLAPARPPLVTVAPWGTLVALALAALVVFWAASWAVTASLVARRRGP